MEAPVVADTTDGVDTTEGADAVEDDGASDAVDIVEIVVGVEVVEEAVVLDDRVLEVERDETEELWLEEVLDLVLFVEEQAVSPETVETQITAESAIPISL